MPEKRSQEHLEDSQQLAKRASTLDGGQLSTSEHYLSSSNSLHKAASETWRIAIKILLTGEESQCITADGCSALREVQRSTGTSVTISGQDALYPGCTLQEMFVKGNSEEKILQAIFQVCTRILESLGQLSSFEEVPVRQGEGRLKVVVPLKVAKVVLGVRGSAIQHMREQTKVHVHIDHNNIPPGPQTELTEQVICLDGPIVGIQQALQIIISIVTQQSNEPWFDNWMDHSYAGSTFPNLILFAPAKGKGKNGAGPFSMVCNGTSGAVGSTSALGDGIPAALKLYLSTEEASIVCGKGGGTIREICEGTEAKLYLSGRFEYYPGTKLQELRVVAWNEEAVVSACMQAARYVQRTTGMDTSRVHLLLAAPCAVASNLAGSEGSAKTQRLKEQSRVVVHVSELVWPPGPHTSLSDQLITISGPLENIPQGLLLLLSYIKRISSETWFNDWAGHSHCVRDPYSGNSKGCSGAPKSGYGLCKGQGRGPAPHQQPPVGHWEQWDGCKGGGWGALQHQQQFAEHWETWDGCQGGDVWWPADADASEWWGSAGAAEYSGAADYHSGGAGYGGYPGKGWQNGVAPPYEQGSPHGYSGGGGAYSAGGYPHQDAAAPMTIKLLVDANEVNCIRGDNDCGLKEVQVATGTTLDLSEADFPGIPLQELRIQGPALEPVADALAKILDNIARAMGVVASGDLSAEMGTARVKLVVPSKSAASIIGPGGQSAKMLKMRHMCDSSVDRSSIPCLGQVSEQAVLLTGQIESVQSALPEVLSHVARFRQDAWFQHWASHSNAGKVIPGLALFPGKSCGKGGSGNITAWSESAWSASGGGKATKGGCDAACGAAPY